MRTAAPTRSLADDGCAKLYAGAKIGAAFVCKIRKSVLMFSLLRTVSRAPGAELFGKEKMSF